MMNMSTALRGSPVVKLPRSPSVLSTLSSPKRAGAVQKPLLATTAPSVGSDEVLQHALLDAHHKAVELFRVIESKDMLRPGRTEDDINREIFDLAATQFGTRKYWHVRLVRTGDNTVHPIHVKTPDRVLGEDDIAFIDLGPVFENVEADFARNYVIGNDSEKLKLSAALPVIFNKCKMEYQSRPDMTGAELYDFVLRTCEEHGYKYANTYCAHLLGNFSHKMDYGLEDVNFARPENHTPMSAAAPNGDARFWVLEIHILQDPTIGTYGGFYEDLLNI